MRKRLSLILAELLLASSLAGCSNNSTTSEENGSHESASPTPAPSAEPEETESDSLYYEGYVDPFADLKFNGNTFTVHNSSNASHSTMSSTAVFIEGPEELTGDQALDAVYNRNIFVEELLDVDLQFVDFDYSWSQAGGEIRTLINTGETTYDLIVNDIYGLAPLTPDGVFADAYDGEYFDFDNPWWYEDFMKDISINEKLRFILAGDYFLDLLRTSHALYMNKNVYTAMNLGDPEDVYQSVINHEWTLDAMKALTDRCYVDLNGNTAADAADQYGYIAMTSWGPLIPFIISFDPGFIERDEAGYPVITVSNERSQKVVERLVDFYYGPTNFTAQLDEDKTLAMFLEGRSLFVGYQRLGTLENTAVRETEVDLAVLPYPMLDNAQEDYVTSAHDTSELGFIPITVPADRIDFVSAVVEVLNRETWAQVLPVYYENSLKIKYTRDQSSAQMIDIIHDHFGNGFALAYSNGLSGILLKETFGNTIEAKSTDFSSVYASKYKAASKVLEKWIKSYEKLIGG